MGSTAHAGHRTAADASTPSEDADAPTEDAVEEGMPAREARTDWPPPGTIVRGPTSRRRWRGQDG